MRGIVDYAGYLRFSRVVKYPALLGTVGQEASFWQQVLVGKPRPIALA
jgi:hypothetical protein